MTLLLTPEGLQAIKAVLARRPLLAFDFDGTLAPIVPHPDAAVVSPRVAQQLQSLARRLPTAIVTGRAVADVLPRLGFQPHYVIGNHGAEGPGSTLPRAAIIAMDNLRQQIAAQSAALQGAGVLIEDKRHSLTLHHRLAPDQAMATAAIEQVLTGLDPSLGRFGGKFVVNVVAAGAPDKGDALVLLVEQAQAGSALFIGDDVNDESVFERAQDHWVTVRIGREDASSRARFFLDEQTEVTVVLDQLITLLEQIDPAGPTESRPDQL